MTKEESKSNLYKDQFDHPCVALLGGSFDPPHDGHLLPCLDALTYLPRIVWLPTMSNPTKNPPKLLFKERMQLCKEMTEPHPLIQVSDYEYKAGTNKTLQTLSLLKKDFPETNFIFMMGSDLVFSFHRWIGWEDILKLVPIFVMPRANFLENIDDTPFMKRMKEDAYSPNQITQIKAPAYCVNQNQRLINVSSSSLNSAGSKIQYTK